MLWKSKTLTKYLKKIKKLPNPRHHLLYNPIANLINNLKAKMLLSILPKLSILKRMKNHWIKNNRSLKRLSKDFMAKKLLKNKKRNPELSWKEYLFVLYEGTS